MSKQAVLVVGGAGFIGSHMCTLLDAAGYAVIVLDSLVSSRHRAAIPGVFVEGDMADSALVERICRQHRIDAALHFAAFIEVGESVRDPAKYFENNVIKTLKLVEALRAASVDKFIFSSTASVYGLPGAEAIDESLPVKPINPYGMTKLSIEQALASYEQAYGFRSVRLRYFNAAGADPEGELGECHDPETHLIPLILQAASGRRDHIKLFGDDYGTPDGSCIRDYVHVLDLCRAHLAALERLNAGLPGDVYNLGNGGGYSVLEVVEAAREVTGCEIEVRREARRPGDPDVLVADAGKARRDLGWTPEYGLRDIIAHAWRWEQVLCAERGAPAQGTPLR
ncbi:MAG: UDP-glucose 4-epimerase GalE [Salinisphaeraceae bacterium]|nr:UDP-glucose 4-epimerase GalE [Salinisphaeraceae bacterium]